ncbi:uncharacterized protein STEHIDRAFT_110905 [Stereum hirsutum FP-91666 SS1]|uniref:uncharacterized protein n=1 Tax=Stereum hirsutum (strain FP-91666) TaxID=721885 RepID=UPI000440A204|nr:uncharacterized protein STEHIDRAFT_110905 [Stereum hirsutum FP-91666 SS1]EIM86383.1 hypothetical protein STEHIDRAFT_110905 [Stereum hirsutum FP-91666 SS1]
MTSIHSTLGALEIGILLMLLLFGIMITQAYTHYQSKTTTDNRILRILVPLMLITELVHTALMCSDFYTTSINDYGDFPRIDAAHWTGVFAQPVSSLSTGIIQGIPLLSTIFTDYRWPISVCIASAVAVDVLNTTAFCYCLWKRKSDFEHHSSPETGMLTFIFTSLELIFFLVLPNTSMFLCFISFGTKVYSNSLLALLNGRSALVEGPA